ncbi:hypothetical protein NOF04DRAFT_1347253 [Fusarium oxysporum II5]|nr:hypothetical protein NOF04DRAFT_1347253 [Fusarium oxysporum II5]
MKSQILIWTLLGARGVLAGVYHGVMHMETRPGQSNGRLTGPSSLQDIAGNSSVSVTQTESQSALRTVVASGTTEVSTSSGFESLSVESQLTQVQPGSETPITTEKITSTSSAVLESTFSAVSLITSTGIIESTGRIVIFLIREPTPNTQKRSFNRRQNTDKRFVGNGNPDTCTYAESFNLAQEQLFIDGVPFFYNGQDYTELRARPVPQVGAVTRIFITSGRLLEIRNPDVPDGAGFCLARDGTVYVTFTSGPASCVPIILEVYDPKDTSTAESSHESATESSSISQYQSVAPISEPTTSSKASTAESSSASTSSSFTTGITTSETSTEPNVSSPVPRESSTEGVSLTTALTSTSAVSTSSETEESTSIKPASSETSEAGTTSSEESTSSVEPETSTVESTTAASESETTTVQSATSTESTTSETSTSESNTLQSSTLQSTSSQSTSSESTTNRPSTTIAQTTSNSPTTTTLGATPTNADECTALSNPYIASNGDRFDLSFITKSGSGRKGRIWGKAKLKSL